MHTEAVAVFEKQIEDYEKCFNKEILSRKITYPEYDFGTYDEEEYRNWCLRNHLFLNPLNNPMTPESAFAYDPLTITQYTEYVLRDDVCEKSNGNPPKWFAMLNQLKEEFIYARLLCYEGIEKRDQPHFADRNVRFSLANYDYVNYSIRLEQLKSAFRISYSLFDQKEYDALAAEHEKLSRQMQEVEIQRKDKTDRRRKIEIFLHMLEEHEECVSFDTYTFVALVDKVVVGQDGKLEFVFRNGMSYCWIMQRLQCSI